MIIEIISQNMRTVIDSCLINQYLFTDLAKSSIVHTSRQIEPRVKQQRYVRLTIDTYIIHL